MTKTSMATPGWDAAKEKKRESDNSDTTTMWHNCQLSIADLATMAGIFAAVFITFPLLIISLTFWVEVLHG